jgi:hemerythrin
MINLNELPQVALECLHQDHLDVAAMLNQLLADLDGPASVTALTAQFNALIEHCANHFFCEEKQMGSFKYPRLEEHQAEHQRAVAEVMAVQQQWQSDADRQQLKRYLSESFTPWLLDHIQGVDIAASQFIYDAGGR